MRAERIFTFLILPLCLWAIPAMATPVQEIKTPGGFTAWLIEERAVPALAVTVAFKEAGSARDEAGKEGRAALLAQLLLEGAGEMNAQAFTTALDERAIRMRFSADEDLFRGSMDTLSEMRDEAFRLLAAALAAPRFDPDAIERAQEKARTDLAEMMESPGYILNRAFREQAFPGHPYGRAPYGTPESIAALTREDFEAFRKTHLTRENLLIAVVGDITAGDLVALLDKHLAGLPGRFTPAGSIPDVTVPPPPAQPAKIARDIPQTLVMFGTQGLKRSDPRYLDAHVLNHILGGGGSLVSRLGQEIREKRGLAYYASSDLDPMLHGALLEGSFATRNDAVGEAVDVLRGTIRDVHEKGVTEKELEDAKRYIIGSFPLGLDSNREVAGFLIAMQLHGLGRDYLDRRNALMEKVALKDVNALAHALLDPARLHVVMVGNPKDDSEARKK